MGRVEEQHDRKLTQKQLTILKLLYRFRFATTDLIAQSLGKSDGGKVYRSLRTLHERGVIGRNYEPEYRLRGQYASYYLATDGIKALKKIPNGNFDSQVFHNIYRDKTASNQFISHNLAILDAYCQLKKRYGQQLQFFTKSDLVTYTHFPQPLPDAYLRFEHEGKVKQFFLDIHQSAKPFFLMTRRVKLYAEYADSAAWEVTETDLPDILTVCDSDTLQKRLQKRIEKLVHPELNFFLTTSAALQKLTHNTSIWQPARTPDEQTSLEFIGD